MATTDPIHNALTQFLAGDQPSVVAIKGAWGVGKTYYWHDFVANTKSITNCVAYSYVSLFGIGSLNELRRSIFARQTAGRSLDNKLAMVTRKYSAGALRAFKASAVGVENTDAWADVIEDKTLQKFLVCIDDLERREDDLSASALLGFIANLRDERKCKVVLLYNDDEIESESEMGKTLAAYREKVIDRELTFQPTVARSYSLVFGEAHKLRARKDIPSTPFHPSERRSLLEIFETARTANIRVMRRAKDMLDYCAPHMTQKYPNLWPSFARQVAKVFCLYFVHGRDIDLATVTDTKAWAHFLMTNREKKQEEHVKKYGVVGDVGYFQMGCDVLILDYLKFGFIDWATHTELLEEQEKEHAKSHLNVKLGKIWELIWDDFTADQVQFCRQMNAFLDRHGKKLTLGELSNAVDALKELGSSNAGAEALLSTRVDEYVEKNGEGALTYLHYGVVAEGTANMIRKKVAARVVKKSIAEVISAMSEESSYAPGEEKHLKDCSEEDFYRYIKTTQGPGFLERLNTFKDRIGNDEVGKVVRERFEKALTRLWDEAKINQRRLRYGVKFVPPSADSHKVPDKS